MTSFIIALLTLLVGSFLYGKFVEKVFGADGKRKTPVHTMADGVDYVPLPTWKIFLIQFLNIAGLGPIFGAIMGVMYGPSAFLWIVFGTIFAGSVHDYLSGMLSLRYGGASQPEIVGAELGNRVKNVMRAFALLLMILVGAVFVYNPADLLAMLTPESLDKTFWIVLIFCYYMLATLLPIDKLIGKLYPLFGVALLFMAVGILAMLFVHHQAVPEIWDQFYNHTANPEQTPVFPMMFVSIACGAISGFHATQSPMMARCMKSEKHGRWIFHGAMVTEGVVALIWAAAAVAFTGGYDKLGEYLGNGSPAILVNNLSETRHIRRHPCRPRRHSRSHHLRRHRAALSPAHRRRLPAFPAEENQEPPDGVGPHLRALLRGDAHALRRAVALLRMVQPGALRLHPLGRNRMARQAAQELLHHPHPGTLHDGRDGDIHLLRPRRALVADPGVLRQ